MDKNKLKKIGIMSIMTVIVFIGVGFSTYKYNKRQSYNNLITTANKYMDSGEYDKAIALFNQSLQYKNDTTIQRNIKLATNLKELKVIYDDGVRLMNDKKYLEAIEQLKKITKEDDRLYNNAQKSIEECKKQYILQNIELANNSAKSNKYDDANKYLDEVLKIDSNNTEAKKIKEDIAEVIKEQQKKNEEEQKVKVASNVNSASITNNTNRNITPEQACETIKGIYPNKSGKTVVEYDHDESLNGVSYHIIHVYSDMGDHTATIAWCYVNVNNGKAYKMNIATNQLTSLN